MARTAVIMRWADRAQRPHTSPDLGRAHEQGPGESGCWCSTAESGPENRRRPVQVNAHLGETAAGGHIQIGAAGATSDPCSDDGSPIDDFNA